jgi:uncharacterized membrane protein (UPF0127 family)
VRIVTGDGRVICERCEVAGTFWTRFRGLMGRKELAPGNGMIFRPGGSVHMFFMRFPVDVVFCDRDLRVLRTRERLRPWRVAGARHAKITIELAAGEVHARGLELGDQLKELA